MITTSTAATAANNSANPSNLNLVKKIEQPNKQPFLEQKPKINPKPNFAQKPDKEKEVQNDKASEYLSLIKGL